MQELLQEIAPLSSLISYRELRGSEIPAGKRTPSFRITRVGADMGIDFAGIPMGHEFTSLVLALLQAGGYPPKVDAPVIEQVKALEGEFNFEIFISLSCHNCPEVVQSLNLLAVLNPGVRTTMIDGALFQAEVEARQIMAVPYVFLNGKEFSQGRISLEEILAKIDTSAGERAAEAISAKEPFDVLVVGGGPAGSSAAIYAARKGIRTGVVADRFGGQVMDTLGIENFISVKATEGPKLAAALEEHVKHYEVDIMNLQRAARLEPAGDDGLFTVTLESGAHVKSKTVIISTGARWRQMNVPGEKEYSGKGVAYCPHCDGPLFKGKRVAVIGGGNSGVEAAIDLAGIVAHVTLIEFDGKLRADEVLQRKLRSLPNVHVIVSAQTTEVHGADGKVNALSYKDRSTRRDPPRRARGRVRADRPAAQHRLAQGHGRAVAARRDRSRRQGPDVAARRVRGRRRHDGAVQADHHRDGRRLEGGAQRVRSPDPRAGAGVRRSRGSLRADSGFHHCPEQAADYRYRLIGHPGAWMETFSLLFTTDYGLMSLGVILFIIVMGFYLSGSSRS